jgi:glucan-binding YG repeat protein
MRTYIASAALVFALGLGQTAFAAENGMGTGENGYGYYHESNGAATGWGTQNNGYGFYHESNAGSTGWGNASNGNGYYHESNGSATVRGVQLH